MGMSVNVVDPSCCFPRVAMLSREGNICFSGSHVFPRVAMLSREGNNFLSGSHVVMGLFLLAKSRFDLASSDVELLDYGNFLVNRFHLERLELDKQQNITLYCICVCVCGPLWVW